MQDLTPPRNVAMQDLTPLAILAQDLTPLA